MAVKPYRNIARRAVKATDTYFSTNPTWKYPDETLAIRQLFARSLASIYRVKSTPVLTSANAGSGVSNIKFFKTLGKALGREDARRWAHGLYKAARPTLYASKVTAR